MENYKMQYELYHHGILGMKWGIRRFQNKDGSLTPAGRKRLQKYNRNMEKAQRKYESAGFFERRKAREEYNKTRDKYNDFAKKLQYAKMTDEELLEASRDFVKSNFNNTLTSEEVKKGELSIQDKVKLMSSVVDLGSNAVSLVGKVKDVFGKGDAIKRDLDERKMRLDERKQALDEKKQADDRQYEIDKRKISLEESKNRRYWRAFRLNVESGTPDLSKEEKDEIKRKSK